MRRGGKAYFAANLVSQASALARYVILVRLLGEHELGLAAMLILTAQFFDAVSDTGSDRFIVQDVDGDTARMQGAVQMVLAARGVLVAVALALTAGLLAKLYGEPGLATPLIAIGLAPLIAGFAHLDLRRVQRDQDFRPESLAMLASETLSLIATSIAAYITRDHTAVIYGLVLRSLALVTISHLTAKRSYRWALGKPELRRFSLFAMPLFLNGFLLFIGGQGDRLVVANGLGAVALGQYSAVLLLVHYPATMVGRFLVGIHLPQVSASRHAPEALSDARWRLGSQAVILSAGIVVGFTVVAPAFVPLLYGQRFGQPLQVIALLGFLQGMRFLRVWPTAVAMGAGRSVVVMLNNVVRLVGLPLAFAAYTYWGTLESVVAGFIVGEVLALTAALVLLRHTNALKLGSELRRVGPLLGLAAATVTAAWMLQNGDLLKAGIAIAALGVMMIGIYLGERSTVATTWTLIAERLRRRARG